MLTAARRFLFDRLVPLAVFLATLLVSVLVLSVHRGIEDKRETAATTLAVTNFAARLETHLSARLNAGRLLGLRFLRTEEMDAKAFRTETTFLHELFQDFQALNWVDSDGVIRIVTPEEGNTPALGLNLRRLPVPGAALARADATGEMQVTPPITLAQGGTGFVAYVPVTSGERRAGYINIVFLAEPLIRSALGEELDMLYDIEVSGEGKLLFGTGEMPTGTDDVAERVIRVAGQEWTLKALPKPMDGTRPLGLMDAVILVGGIVVAGLLSFLSHIAIVRQRALTESRLRQRDFAAATSDWFWEMDRDQRLVWCSVGAERFYNRPCEELLGKTRMEFRDLAGDDEAWAAHRADLAARRPFRDFSYAVRIDGQRRWVRVSGVPTFDSRGEFTGYRGSAADITELVRSRSKVEQSNATLANAVEELSELFSLWDEDDRLVFGNRVFRAINSSIPHVTVPGTRFEDYLRACVEAGHMRDLDGREEEFIQNSIARRYSDRPEPFEIEQADGTVLLLHEQKLAEGGFITIGLDVTRQRRSELALRASEERLALASQQLSIWDWNLETDEVYMSPGFAERLGYSSEEFAAIRDASISSIIHPDDLEGYRAKLHDHLVDPTTTLTSEHRFRTRSGEYRWFLALGQVEVDENGKAVRSTGVLTDIDDRVHLETALRQAQKMEAIGNLTGGIAHDFNNLLTVILGNLELIREFNRDRNVQELAEAGIAATQRGADLVRNMLGFARKSRLQPVVTDLNQVLERTTSWVARTLPETISVDTVAPESLWQVKIDPALTQNALLNLILNARDAMP